MCMYQVKRKVIIKKLDFMRKQSRFSIIFLVPYENSLRVFQCKSGEIEYFQTDNWK